METLEQIYDRHKERTPNTGHGDKGTVHSYLPIYEDLLAPYRAECSFLEIGLAVGQSVAMWDEYFADGCQLTGVDINLQVDPDIFDRWFLIEGSILDAPLPDDLFFDVVIDDGSHLLREQVATWQRLKPRMNPGGIYIIEDVYNPTDVIKSFPGGELIDLRHVKGRNDDALIVLRT